MFNHEPDDYRCPFCRLVAGGEDERRTQRDVVRRAELATAFVSPRCWPNNHGHVLIVPNAHHENLYDLPRRYGHAPAEQRWPYADKLRRHFESAAPN
jgi:histidine triad (HIT) family protein